MKLLITSVTALGLTAGLMTVGPDATPAAHAATAPCFDAPSNDNCNGVPVSQPSNTGGTCWLFAQQVPKSHPDIRYYYDPATNVTYVVTLWYSTRCLTNWAQVTVYATWAYTPYGVWASTKVRRYAGWDGGYLMYHAGATYVPSGENKTIYSPMVYAPEEQAQACVSLPPFTGNPDQIVCTGAY